MNEKKRDELKKTNVRIVFVSLQGGRPVWIRYPEAGPPSVNRTATTSTSSLVQRLVHREQVLLLLLLKTRSASAEAAQAAHRSGGTAPIPRHHLQLASARRARRFLVGIYSFFLFFILVEACRVLFLWVWPSTRSRARALAWVMPIGGCKFM